MKNKLNYFFIGLFIGIIVVGGICAFFQPTPKIIVPDKMKECIDAGGEFSLSDWSLRDDGSDYRITCNVPERQIWKYKF
jgi:hypothetical protein